MGKKMIDEAGGCIEQDPKRRDCSIGEILKERGVSRRDFLKFCSAMTAAMALPASFAPRVAQALDEVKRPTLVWLEMQSCTGDTEALLRSANPTVAEIILDILSVDYHETIMAAAGRVETKISVAALLSPGFRLAARLSNATTDPSAESAGSSDG